MEVKPGFSTSEYENMYRIFGRNILKKFATKLFENCN
jgi:hypothetical protein